MAYRQKPYGRNTEVDEIYRHFTAGQDLHMPGPRRLGKSFLLDRLVDAGPEHGWRTIKIELAGISDPASCYARLSEAIGASLPAMHKIKIWLAQHAHQVFSSSKPAGSSLPQHLLTHDSEGHLERLLVSLADEPQPLAILLDELPIFLNALHHKGPDGVAQAREFMNTLSRVRDKARHVRWLITGSIGIDPLARFGQYQGALAKYTLYRLAPLTAGQAKDLLQDSATDGLFIHRQRITDAEAQALIEQTGWLSAFYLLELAQRLRGAPCENAAQAAQQVENAAAELLGDANSNTFSTWEEHLRKHYPDPQRGQAFALLAELARRPGPHTLNTLLAGLADATVSEPALRALLLRLDGEGFVSADWDNADSPTFMFRNPLLRRWWARYQPTAA